MAPLATARREFTVAGAHQYDVRSPIRWVLSHVRRYPWLPVLAIFGSIICNWFFSYGAVLLGQAADTVMRPGVTLNDLLVAALVVMGARVASGLTNLISGFAFELTAQRVERDAREELYLSLLGKSQTFHNRQRVGDIMARATNDIKQINMMIMPALGLITDAGMSLIIPFILIGFLNPLLLITPSIFLVGFIITLRMYMRDLSPVAEAKQAQYGNLSAGLNESIGGIEVVKAYAQEEQEHKRFQNLASLYRDLTVKEGQIKARYLPLLLFGMAYAIGVGHAIWLVATGVISIGQAIAFSELMRIIEFPTFISLFTFSMVQGGIAGSERILKLINEDTEMDENAAGAVQPIQGAITFDQVSFGYGGAPILRNISFEASPGETVAIVGQTGAGKSTLTRLVNRTYDTTEGRVLIDGTDVREWTMESLRSQIAIIEQDIFLFSRSIADNIAFGAGTEMTREQIEQAAKDAQAHDFIMRFPEGYDTIVGERGVTLSGGQRQRIAIARAFLTDPRILVLDDSTSAIDSATEDQIQRALRHILRGRTTLLITHRLSQIRWADRIIVLRNGEIAAQGTHEDLMQTSDAYRHIFARYETSKTKGPEAVQSGQATEPSLVG